MPLNAGSSRRAVLATMLLCAPLAAVSQATTKAAQQTPAPETPAPVVNKTPTSLVEVGTIDGVPYRIDVPSDWNHNLIVYFHGYSTSPLHYKADAPENAKLRPILHKGYAMIQSAYAQPGWALQWGFNDTEKLRKYFVKKYNQPRESYVVGESMGGGLTLMTIEKNPKPYMGALNLCGAAGSTQDKQNRRFALRAAFDFYFPALLPSINLVPANFVETEALRQKVLVALNGKPAAAEAMRNLTGLHVNQEIARMMVYYTFIIGDLQRKSGGNPFDNHNTIYTGTSADPKTDYALNDGVARYMADPHALRYLVDNYEGTGRLTKRVLALHTVYDPTIPASSLTAYHQLVARQGFSANYVQQYVHREGHCTMTPEEIGHAFDELVGWVHGGHTPAAGLLK